MLYKTMLLELLPQYPKLHEQLRQNGTMLATLNELAEWFKTRHATWSAAFSTQSPESPSSQFRQPALEMALREMEHVLASEWPPIAMEPLSLEAAIAFLKHRSSNE